MKTKGTISKTTFINSKVTSAISVALVLFLLGLIVLLSLFANNLSRYVKENLSFSIILNDDMKESDIRLFQAKIEAQPYTKSVQYMSKQKAAEEMTKELGENPETFLGYNPFHATLEVNLNSEYANSEDLTVIEKNLRKDSNVGDLIYRKDLMDSVNQNMNRIMFVLSVLAGLLLFISFALINNTIRLMIYSKRFLIHTMKLVGASNSFIRKPFIISNLFSGIIAGFVASGLLLGVLYYVANGVNNILELVNTEMLLIVFASIMISGILISVLATCFAVNKYLRTKGGDLYYI